jgi:peptidoglycan/LPS O-acetylase OafA/YrhL
MIEATPCSPDPRPVPADPRQRLLANLRRRHIPGLDGIRGIAALSVVAHHCTAYVFPGRLAVQLFFVISGLLITWLLLEEQHGSSTVDRAAFYWRRAFRLLPALFVLLAWESLTDFPHVTHASILAAVFYYANYHYIFGGQALALAPTWSLAVEEHFYLIWPQVFLFVRNRRALLRGCLVVAAIECVCRMMLNYRGSYLYGSLATETSSAAILVGCALALLLWDSPKRLPGIVLRPFMAPLALAGTLTLAQLPERPQLYWEYAVGIPLAVVIVLQAITYEWRILENPVARFLGGISYGIYLWGFVAQAIARWFGHEVKHTSLFFVVVALAAGSHYLVERPIQSLGRRWLAARRQAARVAAEMVGVC